jgi:hypothetical protein
LAFFTVLFKKSGIDGSVLVVFNKNGYQNMILEDFCRKNKV